MSEDFTAKLIEIATNVAMFHQNIAQTLATLPLPIAIPVSENGLVETAESMAHAADAVAHMAEDGLIDEVTAGMLQQAMVHWLLASYTGRAYKISQEEAAYSSTMVALEMGDNELALAKGMLNKKYEK